jgi:hypothetical protein
MRISAHHAFSPCGAQTITRHLSQVVAAFKAESFILAARFRPSRRAEKWRGGFIAARCAPEFPRKNAAAA